MPFERTHRSRFRIRKAWIVALALTVSGGVLADAGPTAESVDVERRTGIRLDRERLLPRVSIELESFATFGLQAAPGSRLSDHVLFDELSESVRRGAERTTRRVVRDYLFRASNLDRGIDQARAGIFGSSEPRNLRFTFGVHSMNPEVGLERRVGQQVLRFVIEPTGDVSLRLRGARFERSEVAVRYDGDDTFTLRARLAF